MRKEIQDQFEAVFAQYEEKERQRRLAREARESEQAEFLRKFRKLCATTIRPALDQLAEYLDSRGLKTRIEQTVEKNGQDGRVETPEALTFYLLQEGPDARGRSTSARDYPHLSLMAEKYRQRIQLYRSTMGAGRGGEGGMVGEVSMDQLTDELLHGKVLELVSKVLL